jgi:hypothetical protein
MDTDESNSTTSHSVQHPIYAQFAQNLTGSFQGSELETPQASLEDYPKGDKTHTSDELEVGYHNIWSLELCFGVPLSLYTSTMTVDERLNYRALSNEMPDPVFHISGDDNSTEEEGACILRANTACVDQLWDTQHDNAWKYLGDHLYYVFLNHKSVNQPPEEGTDQPPDEGTVLIHPYEFLENCVLRGIEKEVLEDLMTIRGTHRYQQEAIVFNLRTKRFEWNPFGNDPYHSTAKINTEVDARLLYEAAGTYRHNQPAQPRARDYRNYSNDPDWTAKGKNWHRPSPKRLKMQNDIKSELLPKSSIMGMKGEYNPDFLDQVLQHACLIP